MGFRMGTVVELKYLVLNTLALRTKVDQKGTSIVQLLTCV